MSTQGRMRTRRGAEAFQGERTLSDHPTLRQRRRSPEADLHRSVIQFLELAHLTALWWHTPNERRDKTEAQKLKALGVKAGVPDLIFVSKGFTAFIELKARRGSLSPAQRDFRDQCAALEIPYGVAREVVDVHDLLVSWGMIRPGKVRIHAPA